ncbi:toprim domain-containing protein [Paeniroseomonas aquatica]|uniref:toprim domain-containing protein n=1 Tax=Paeniroseomonas aquatica TaxID=373043 RepID=UPI0036151F1C
MVVVEGYMDVIALHQAGFSGAVAPLGTALTAEQLEALWQVSPEPVLCFDGDAAGVKAAGRSAELALPLLAPDRSLRLATIAGGEDPDTLVAKGGPAAFQAVLDAARPLSVALYDLLAGASPPATPEQRAGFRNRLEEAAKAIPDRALAAEYKRALLDRFFASGRGARPAFAPGASRARPGPRARGGAGRASCPASPGCSGWRSTSPASGWSGPATCWPSWSATPPSCRRWRRRWGRWTCPRGVPGAAGRTSSLAACGGRP